MEAIIESAQQSQVSQVLLNVAAGHSSAVEQLLPLVYDELRALARGYLRRERMDHTLEPTALVHEVYLRLVDSKARNDWQGRAHFRAIAARAMRQLLVEHARRKKAAKRGGDWQRISFTERLVAESPGTAVGVPEFDHMLARLRDLDEMMSLAVEMRYLAAMDNEEIAHVLGVTSRTVRNKLSVARAWLSREYARRDAR